MTISGLFKAGDAIRACLANEYAFEIRYPGKLVRIGHCKGTWHCAQFADGLPAPARWIRVRDGFGGCEASDDLSGAFYLKIQAIHAENRGGGTPSRADEAACLEDFLAVWAAPADSAKTIRVVQPGRNAALDAGGNFVLAWKAS